MEEKEGALLSCLNPKQAQILYKNVLCEYENSEIHTYKEIYYLGQIAKKVKGNKDISKNYGYDDEENRYRIVQNDHISYRYQIIEMLGQGSFGSVVKAIDHKNQKSVALKIIKNEPHFHRQVKEEIKLLNHLKQNNCKNSNCIIINETFIFRGHMCLTFPLMGKNLYELLKQDNFNGFDHAKVKSYASEIAKGLAFLKTQKIIHCDLKPENIVASLNDKTKIKIIDFGSSCYEGEQVYTYIQSRFYRAPEIILRGKYGIEIDIWSYGCIIYELSTGRPLFPGENEFDQMTCIMAVKGLPPNDMLTNCKKTHKYFTKKGLPKYCQVVNDQQNSSESKVIKSPRGKIRELPGKKKIGKNLGNDFNSQFFSYLEKCLHYTPAKRLKPEEYMKHSWFDIEFNEIIEENTSPVVKTDSGHSTASKSLTDVVGNSNSDVGDNEEQADSFTSLKKNDKILKILNSNKTLNSINEDSQSSVTNLQESSEASKFHLKINNSNATDRYGHKINLQHLVANKKQMNRADSEQVKN